MKKRNLFIIAGCIAVLFFGTLYGQETKPSIADFGKMWTFEDPPKGKLQEDYGFSPDDSWYNDVRLSALKFANWCSASFVSPNGLIMTNHHCSRDVVGKLQQEGENFDTQGFYASDPSKERKAEGLFVEQLRNIADITDRVKELSGGSENEMDRQRLIQEAFGTIKEEYEKKPAWEGLRLQVVTYYSGGKYSLYGYKKYSDIRLVLIPEIDLGFYGGDPDNFTYPRYNLDATFWRAYDEQGKPLDTSGNYFKFNPEGVTEDALCFVVGNPGSTERYRTIAQLKYDRDYRYPMILRFLNNRYDLMMKEYQELLQDESKTMEAQEKLNTAFSFSNSIKAYSGILKGLNDEALVQRKADMEKYVRSKSPNVDYWTPLQKATEALKPYVWAATHLSPSSYSGKALQMMHALYNYENMITDEMTPKEIDSVKHKIVDLSNGLNTPRELALFTVLLKELQVDVYATNNSMEKVLEGRSPEQLAKDVFMNSLFMDPKRTKGVLGNTKKLAKNEDILLRTARILIPQYLDATLKFDTSSPDREQLEQKIANQYFEVFGTDLPPDATFTLRLSDGVVQGYDYNGTEAPYKTTYYGMYNRHYSNDGEFPWSLPEKWKNPPMDLLKSPINFVSTNDIIGGNSGSAVINEKKEAIGLAFDSNIEALPGRFIYDPIKNRTVSVHTGGIMAALQYIYKADRLLDELKK